MIALVRIWESALGRFLPDKSDGVCQIKVEVAHLRRVYFSLDEDVHLGRFGH